MSQKKTTKTTRTTRTRNGVTKITTIIEEEIQASAPKPQLTNHIVVLLDDSGSMSGCYREAVLQLNKTFANIREQAAKTGQRTTVTLYLFGDSVRQVYFRQPVETLRDLSDHFYSGGCTKLRDAVCGAIDDQLKQADVLDPNTSFLVVCATDGGENASRTYREEALSRMLRAQQNTDRWTFAFMGPAGSKSEMERWGVPSGNIIEWENTVRGAQVAFNQNMAATNSYYTSRSAGMKSVKNYFTPDLSTLKKSDLSKLDDLSSSFRKWSVDREVDIKTFVEYHGVRFVLGAGYYSLTKKEKLRTGRQVLVRDKTTKRIYGGDQARSILGMPAGEVYVTPGNHANYDIFFQSTSVNRRLVRGTELLWDKTKLTDDQETWDSAAAKAAADAKALAASQKSY